MSLDEYIRRLFGIVLIQNKINNKGLIYGGTVHSKNCVH